MLRERIEGKWIDAFATVFEMSKVTPGEIVVVLSETQSRAVNVELAELALLRLGAKIFHLVLPTPKLETPVPIRSTGGSVAIGELGPVVDVLAACGLVVDLTVEGLLHAKERPAILEHGARILMISNEHPELLERLMPDPSLKPKVQRGVEMALGARQMRATSPAGTDITVDMEGAMTGGGWGFADEKGKMDYWPGGLCAFYPKGGAVNGTVVLDAGDVNLTFKRLIERPVRLMIDNDFITSIEGEGTDAELMRSYFAAWGDKEAYATAHLGWGMNPAARWDALVMYDKGQMNGTEQRAFAGNFLFSTGSNHFADRFTLGHFDIPMRNCTITLDNKTIVDKGRLLEPLA